jgi:class 3 adenylate cyclase
MNTSINGWSVRTVLELDLVSFSTIVEEIEDTLDARAVLMLEDQIQGFVDQALTRLGMHREEVVLGTSGDNAIMVFDSPVRMHEFASLFQNASAEYNRRRPSKLAQRWFRMGAATGEVLVQERRIIGTSTLIRAVRLERAGRPGQVLVDSTTLELLPESLQRLYESEELIEGKREERFLARRCRFFQAADLEPGSKVKGVVWLAAGFGLASLIALAFVVWRAGWLQSRPELIVIPAKEIAPPGPDE